LRYVFNSPKLRPIRFREPQKENNESDDEEISQDDNGDDDALPCPIPFQAGEFASLMEDVIKLQNDQPWLVSVDARVPTKANGDVVATTDNMKNTGRDLNLSKKIRSARDRMLSSNNTKAFEVSKKISRPFP
jgi:hypothetical protein